MENNNWEEKLKTIIGGFCWAQDGGNGGYEFWDITQFIKDNFVPKEDVEREIDRKVKKFMEIHEKAMRARMYEKGNEMYGCAEVLNELKNTLLNKNI
jgi:hypothetical protein